MSHQDPGPTLLGFSDFFEGDEIGAAKRPARPPAKAPTKGAARAPVRPAPPSKGRPGGGKTIYGPAVAIKNNPTVQKSGTRLRSARVTAARALKASTAALKSVVKPKVPAKALAKKAQVGAALVKAVAPQTPKQKAAVARAQAAQKKAADAQKKAASTGLATKNALVDLAKKIKAQRAAALSLKKRRVTKIKGLIGTAIGALLEEHYAMLGAAPDPENPGYLDDGSPDPAYEIDPSMLDPEIMDPTLEAGANLPAPPGMDAVVPDYQAVGGILYDGSKGKKPGWIGSYSYFHQTIVNPKHADRRYGFVHGGDPHDPEWPGNKFDQWVWVHGKKGDSGSIPDFPGQEPGVSGWWDDAAQINRAYLTDANVAKASVAKGYGPIIGNPAWPDFAGLRMDQQGNLFWFPQEAPEWATIVLRQAEAVTAQAEQKAAAAAAAAEAAAQAKMQADAELAQAQQDAANALAESAAASQQAIAEAQQETQAQQIDLQQQAQAQQLDLDQAKVDQAAEAEAARADAEERKFALEQAREDAALARQQQQFALEQARRRAEAAPVMTEEEPGPYDPSEEGYGGEFDELVPEMEDGDEGEGYYEDME